MATVCDATAGEIEAAVDCVGEVPVTPSVQIEPAYASALQRTRNPNSHDESITIPLPVVRSRPVMTR